MNFKFLLDENITVLDEFLPENVINVRELYYQKGLRQYGIEDVDLLNLAKVNGYIVITKDSGMVLRANRRNLDIVFVDGGGYGKRWYLIPRNKHISNRLKLKEYMLKEDNSISNLTV